jgi:hypothetical protein
LERGLRKEARQEKMSILTLEKKRKSDELMEQSQSPTNKGESPATVPHKRVKLNKIDPIMLVPIGKNKCFKFVRPNGTVIRFNIESLVDYLLSSGDFHDPETRLPFSDNDLNEIDAIVSFPQIICIISILLSFLFEVFTCYGYFCAVGKCVVG